MYARPMHINAVMYTQYMCSANDTNGDKKKCKERKKERVQEIERVKRNSEQAILIVAIRLLPRK